ncbi:MAG: DUF368 domain-containing protein [Clostridia bacterium]|nr:DUF368 domain-containing protein [Clostridia bacterium]
MSTLFKSFKKNIKFLIPLVLGFAVGVLLFSKVVDFMLTNFEFHTRYLFLGLVIGTVPLFYKEVKKRGFNNKYYLLIVLGAVLGIFLFSLNRNWFPVVTDPNLLQSVLLGVAVAGSSIIPGVDSAVILSALGLYELYVSSLAQLNISIIVPALLGLVVGAVLISSVMHILIKNFYTITFSVIFGLFLSIIPNVLNQNCAITSVKSLVVALILVVIGFLVSFYFEDVKGNNDKIKKLFKKRTV